MDAVRMGIIGLGNMGTEHARMIGAGEVEGLVLSAIADIREERRAYAAHTFPGAAVFSDASEMMDSGLIDAVIVSVPHYLHPPYVTQALSKGLHAMCEKPAGVYAKAVREMNAAAKRSDKTFAIMFNQRTNCVYRKMRELVTSGELGQIRRTNWLITDWYRSQSYYDSGSWRATWAGEGGGVLLNQCPHNLDLWQWICGLPKSVHAFMRFGKWHDIEVEDDVTAYVEYENGASGVFVTSTGDTPGTNRFEILMDGGKLVAEGGKLTLYKLKVSEPEFNASYTGGFGEPAYKKITVKTDGENPQHKEVLRAFAAHILRGEPLVAPGAEGIRGVMLSNAMHLSAWTGKTVKLPVSEDRFLRELDKRRAVSRLKQVAEVTFTTEGTYGSKEK
jgi:predicted dehydrogenase